VVESLESSSSGSVFFVGHDTSLDALATLMNITWNSSGLYPPDATPPGSALVFEKKSPSGVVAASFLSTTFETELDDITVVPAMFKTVRSPSMTLKQFVEDANTVIDPTCCAPVSPPPPAVKRGGAMPVRMI
jgi:hypothetical protein